MKKEVLLLFMIIALNCNGAILFVLNSGSETLSRINTETGNVENAFASLGSMPNRLAVTEEFIYVVNSGDNTIQKISAETGETITEIFLESSANPYDLIIHEEYIYVSGALTNQLYKVDLETDNLVDQLTVGSNPAGMTICNGKIYVGNSDYMGGYTNCSVMEIDPENLTIINTIATHPNPQYLTTIEGNVHVSCAGNWDNVMGAVQIIDPQSAEVIGTLNIGGYCVDFALTEHRIYVGDAMNTGVYAYNPENYDIVYDSGSALTPGGSVLEAKDEMIAVCGGMWGENFTVSVLDIDENVTATYSVGLYVTDMKFLPETTPVEEEDIVGCDDIICGPNPFTSEVSFYVKNSRSEINDITIYDLRGRVVRKIRGKRNNIWNGLDEANQPVASGIYFCRVSSQDGTQYSTKIMKLR